MDQEREQFSRMLQDAPSIDDCWQPSQILVQPHTFSLRVQAHLENAQTCHA